MSELLSKFSLSLISKILIVASVAIYRFVVFTYPAVFCFFNASFLTLNQQYIFHRLVLLKIASKCIYRKLTNFAYLWWAHRGRYPTDGFENIQQNDLTKWLVKLLKDSAEYNNMVVNKVKE